jgi:hypothetical protein
MFSEPVHLLDEDVPVSCQVIDGLSGLDGILTAGSSLHQRRRAIHYRNGTP